MIDPITQYILEVASYPKGLAKRLPPDLYKALIEWLLPMENEYKYKRKKPTYKDIEEQNDMFYETILEYEDKYRKIAKKEKLFGIYNDGAGDYDGYSFRNGYIWTARHEGGYLERSYHYKEWLKVQREEYKKYMS